MRKKWTVYIGESDCKSVKDCHSEKEFPTSKHAHAFMWAKANCRVPELCWLSAGIDGWDTNHHLKGKAFPDGIASLIRHYIKQENTLQTIADGVDLIVDVRPAKNAPHFIAYCKQMKCEFCFNDVSELDKLCDEYAGILESENGDPEGSINVNLKARYSCISAP